MLYGVCQTLVNLTNTFDKPDIPDEMKQLGEFAKVKLPKFSEKVRSFAELFTFKLEMRGISGCYLLCIFFHSRLKFSFSSATCLG